MALGTEKFKDSLLAAWKDVLDDKTSTNWALFSYEGQTNDLKVVSKGALQMADVSSAYKIRCDLVFADGGIDEMREDLNSGKIMYAFCKVLDPKTSLNKFVLVNWQGEGAPHPRKATSANHIRDVTNLLKGTHVTINARNEEEVDSDIIMEKVSKATASSYSFKDRAETVKDSTPVGTTYKRVIPQQEINSNERDKFWQKEEEEEKKRQESERKRREDEKRKIESEIKLREIEEAAQREAKIKERSKSISVLREVERNELLRVHAANIVEREDDIEDRQREEVERRERSEILKRQRSQEAQALISKRTINARAVFEQNTSAGQMLQRRASYQPSSNTSVVSPVKEKVRWPPAEQDQVVPEPSNPPADRTEINRVTETQSIVVEDTITSQPRILEEQKNGIVEESNGIVEETNGIVEGANGTLNGNEVLSTQTSILERAQPYLDDAYLNNGASLEDYEDEGLRAQALYDYQAADETEISFDPGDIITRIDQIDAGWWQGMAPDGSYGLFPANYVQLLD